MLRKILFIICLCPLSALAQDFQSISGTYTYNASSNMSMEEAKQKAEMRAQNVALGKTFGYAVAEMNTSMVKNSEGSSIENFESLGSSEVRGEWIANERDPQFEIKTTLDGFQVTANVWGKARKISNASIDLSVKVLRNGTDPKFENDIFKNGDDLFLYLKSPISGYVAAYLIDKQNMAYCLLPYMRDKDGSERIENNRNYVFFSVKDVESTLRAYVDEYIMTCEDNTEINYIYVIFSPNEFTKANDSQTNEALPRELPFADFNRWLYQNRLHDAQMVVKKFVVVIKK